MGNEMGMVILGKELLRKTLPYLPQKELRREIIDYIRIGVLDFDELRRKRNMRNEAIVK